MDKEFRIKRNYAEASELLRRAKRLLLDAREAHFAADTKARKVA